MPSKEFVVAVPAFGSVTQRLGDHMIGLAMQRVKDGALDGDPYFSLFSSGKTYMAALKAWDLVSEDLLDQPKLADAGAEIEAFLGKAPVFVVAGGPGAITATYANMAHAGVDVSSLKLCSMNRAARTAGHVSNVRCDNRNVHSRSTIVRQAVMAAHHMATIAREKPLVIELESAERAPLPPRLALRKRREESFFIPAGDDVTRKLEEVQAIWEASQRDKGEDKPSKAHGIAALVMAGARFQVSRWKGEVSSVRIAYDGLLFSDRSVGLNLSRSFAFMKKETLAQIHVRSSDVEDLQLVQAKASRGNARSYKVSVTPETLPSDFRMSQALGRPVPKIAKLVSPENQSKIADCQLGESFPDPVRDIWSSFSSTEIEVLLKEDGYADDLGRIKTPMVRTREAAVRWLARGMPIEQIVSAVEAKNETPYGVACGSLPAIGEGASEESLKSIRAIEQVDGPLTYWDLNGLRTGGNDGWSRANNTSLKNHLNELLGADVVEDAIEGLTKKRATVAMRWMGRGMTPEAVGKLRDVWCDRAPKEAEPEMEMV